MSSPYPPHLPLVFGYGSLLCSHRRPADSATLPATLRGFVRCWAGHYVSLPHPRTGMVIDVCALTLREEADAAIHGVLLYLTQTAFDTLEQQEIGYERRDITEQVDDSPWKPQDRTMQCYIGHHDDSRQTPLVMQSYLDVIMYGYLEHFGEDGPRHFLQTTENWQDFPLLQDRDDPFYPRSIMLSPQLRQWFDELRQHHAPDMQQITLAELA